MRTAEELDRLHDQVVARFPAGVTHEQFKLVTLESADEDGRVYPHSIAGGFMAQHSFLFAMWIKDGTVEPGWIGHHSPMWWKITQKGRDLVAAEGRS